MPQTRTDQLLALLQDAELREEAAKALKSAKNAAREVAALEKKLPKREKKVSKTKTKKAESAKESKKSKKKDAAVAATAAAVDKKARAKAEAPKGKKKRHPVRKLIVVGVIGAIIALVVSEDARKAALDALFGAEEEFQYTPQPAAGSTNGAA